MKKRAFPKNLKFGTYLPIGSGVRLIEISSAVSSLQRFLNEYFDGIAAIKSSADTHKGESLYLDGEHTAYLFRLIMAAIYDHAVIDINIDTTDREFTICFSTKGKYDISDLGVYEELVKAAQKSGFAILFTKNEIALRAAIVRGKIVISAITAKDFGETLARVFFATHDTPSDE